MQTAYNPIASRWRQRWPVCVSRHDVVYRSHREIRFRACSWAKETPGCRCRPGADA